eukprot:jgi/Picsp_1/5969/NSC_03324-R1_---NA---
MACQYDKKVFKLPLGAGSFLPRRCSIAVLRAPKREHRIHDRTKFKMSSSACSDEVLGYIATAMDTPPEWTLDQAAGLVFGGLLIVLYFSSRVIDEYAAASQRKDLGLCGECGGLYSPTDGCMLVNCPMRQQVDRTEK